MTTITPRTTEKAYTAEAQNTYIFSVPKSASKQAIAKAISEEYKVTVLSVRTANRDGKATKFRKGKHAYPGTTFRQDKKYAYVTVKSGDKIKVFEEESTDKATDKTADKSQETTKIKATDEAQSATTKKAGLFTRRRTGNRGDK